MPSSYLPAAPRTAHAARYERIRQLGRGGMGTVDLVKDRETGERVALKRLNCADAESVLRLKREFRALADMRHANLVEIYDLEHDEDGWFLTMEYVNGRNLLEHLQLGASSAASAIETAPSVPSGAEERIGSAFHQLASGVQALHRAGMLHRDLKPANVLVENGRVRILDFGLVGLMHGNEMKLTAAGAVFGTPEYMAPEQAQGTELTEATDWYAVGAMLYEVLTGRCACGEGNPLQIIMRKFEDVRIPSPRELDAAIPEELSELCMALLERDPAKRPRGGEVLSRLSPAKREPSRARVGTDDTAISHTESRAIAPFVGREGDLQRLWQAMHRAQEQQTFVVHVRGASGSGKSTLVERFVDDVEARSSVLGRTDTLVLRSRCYEREAMPFKALDGIIDSLVRHLSRLDGVEVGHYLPEDIEALAQVFPVLERLKPVQQLRSSHRSAGDAVSNRARAEGAFRELFRRLAARRLLLLWIDDLQWGDLDSARILTSWLGGSAKSSVLALFSYRSDEVETSACLQHLLQTTNFGHTQVVDVGPLSSNEIRELSRRHLTTSATEKDAIIEHIVHESGGSPFLALHLASLAAVALARGEFELRAISLETLVDRTNAMLSPEAREMLNVLSVAGRPMPPKLALRAIGVRHGARALVHELRGLNLVRTRDVDGSRLLDVYHDRIREAVCRGLSAERSIQLHEALLSALEFSGRAEPEWLHALSLGCGRQPSALRYGITAAERAMAALAFERAAELYAKCVELSHPEADLAHRVELLRKLATALGCCGRGASAAQLYLDAAKLAPKQERVTLMRMAASHLLRTGHFDEGEALLEEVLGAVGFTVPKTDAGLTAAIAWERWRVRLHGLDGDLRTDGNPSVELLAHFDFLESVRRDLITIDPRKTALFAARSLRCALQLGEPTRLVTGLCIAASLTSAKGSEEAARRASELLGKAGDLVEKIDSPSARAVLQVNGAYVAWAFGRSDEIIEHANNAEKLLRQLPGDDVSGGYFARFVVVVVRLVALHDLGRYKQFLSELDKTIEQARSTENHMALLQLAVLETAADLCRGTLEAAIPRLDAHRRLLPTRRFGLLHALQMIAVGDATVATGQYAWGLPQFEEDWQRYVRSPVKGMAYLASMARTTRVRLHLGAGAAKGTTSDLAAVVAPDLKALAKIPIARCAPTHRSLRARVEALQGNRELASTELGRSAEEYNELGFRGLAALAAYASGLLRGGEEAAGVCEENDRFLRNEGIVDPAAFVRCFFPEAFRTK